MSTNLQNLAPAAVADPTREARLHAHHLNLHPLEQWLARLSVVSALVLMLNPIVSRASAQLSTAPKSTSLSPLLFVPNAVPGSPIRYLARAAHYSVFLSADEADIVLQEEKAPSNDLQRGNLIVVQARASLLRMRFVDANPPTSMDPADHERRPHPSTAIAYRGLYPGMDIILRGDQRRMQLQVNLGPGASAENIVIEFAGATGLSLQADGSAVVHAGNASLLLQRPAILLGDDQTGQSVPGGFRVENGNRLRLLLGTSAPASGRVIGD